VVAQVLAVATVVVPAVASATVVVPAVAVASAAASEAVADLLVLAAAVVAV